MATCRRKIFSVIRSGDLLTEQFQSDQEWRLADGTVSVKVFIVHQHGQNVEVFGSSSSHNQICVFVGCAN